MHYVVKIKFANVEATLQIYVCTMWSETIILQEKQWWGPLFMWLLTQNLSLFFLMDFYYYQFQFQRIVILCHLDTHLIFKLNFVNPLRWVNFCGFFGLFHPFSSIKFPWLEKRGIDIWMNFFKIILTSSIYLVSQNNSTNNSYPPHFQN